MVQKTHKNQYRADDPALPDALSNLPLTRWITDKGWSWFDHQINALNAVRAGQDIIVTAPTGAGKTLSGFLPSFVDLHHGGSQQKLHTLYISPLKALTVDVHRNVGKPIADINLDITYETRTGDTPTGRRQRQKDNPPDMLMTTPESLALLLSYDNAGEYFKHLKYIIVDELHTLFDNKRGDLLSLGLARLQSLSPDARRIGLSATIADPLRAQKWFCRENSAIVSAPTQAQPEIAILETDQRIPWSGHRAAHVLTGIYDQLQNNTMTVVFVNTRSQAEYLFQELWRMNDKDLKIALHHGSLDRELRRKVEANMADGTLDCVVATSSLDLGLDWADVDLVIQVGAPKGVSRLMQRIGRANHRLNEPSRALLAPHNRFEYLECIAACQEIKKERLDGTDFRIGGLDVLAQHIFGMACAGGFFPDDLFAQVKTAGPYKNITRKDFDDVVQFVQNGGYALKNYERFNRLFQRSDGFIELKNKRDIRRYRMNIGTIVEAPMMKVKLGRRYLGQLEENFILNLSPGDTFVFGGQIVEYASVQDNTVIVKKSSSGQARVPNYAGGKMPMSTHLSHSVRRLIGSPAEHKKMPRQICEWLDLHHSKSDLPDDDHLLVESFPFKNRHYMVAYSFAGYNANQTLGFLLMRRMKREGLKPLGFTMTDYALGVWSLNPVNAPGDLFSPEIMTDEFEEWLQDTPLLKRLFRDAAVISGLVERRHPGQEKSGRQVLFSTDVIYDVLQKYEPDHVLLRTIRNDAMHGMIDAARLATLLFESEDRIKFKNLDKISPMAAPLIMQLRRENMSKKDREEFLMDDIETEILEASGANILD